MTSDGSAEASDALVRSFIAAWEHRDTEFILACLTDNAVYHSMPLSPIEGRGAVAAWVRGFAGKPPGRLTIRHQVATRDVVMNERTDVITINGRTVMLAICAVFEMQDGLIATWREYFDLAPARAAYGELPQDT